MYARNAACVASYTVNVVPIYIQIYITKGCDCKGVQGQHIVLGKGVKGQCVVFGTHVLAQHRVHSIIHHKCRANIYTNIHYKGKSQGAVCSSRDTYNTSNCRSFFAKEPLIIEFFCGK